MFHAETAGFRNMSRQRQDHGFIWIPVLKFCSYKLFYGFPQLVQKSIEFLAAVSPSHVTSIFFDGYLRLGAPCLSFVASAKTRSPTTGSPVPQVSFGHTARRCLCLCFRCHQACQCISWQIIPEKLCQHILRNPTRKSPGLFAIHKKGFAFQGSRC